VIPFMTVKSINRDEINKIHSAMVSILSNTGLAVEHAGIREAYASYGAQVDHRADRVWFPEAVINRFLDETEPPDIAGTTPAGPTLASGTAAADECYRPLCPGQLPRTSATDRCVQARAPAFRRGPECPLICISSRAATK
jgi:hypothetical protein